MLGVWAPVVVRSDGCEYYTILHASISSLRHGSAAVRVYAPGEHAEVKNRDLRNC